MSPFDPYRKVAAFGYSVISDDLPFGDAWLLQQRGVIVLPGGISEAAKRGRVTIEIMNLRLRQSHAYHRRAHDPYAVELAAVRLAARELIPLARLGVAIYRDSDPMAICEYLGTTPALLQVRVSNLDSAESQLLCDIDGAIAWDRYDFTRTYQIVRKRADSDELVTWHFARDSHHCGPVLCADVLAGDHLPALEY